MTSLSPHKYNLQQAQISERRSLLLLLHMSHPHPHSSSVLHTSQPLFQLLNFSIVHEFTTGFIPHITDSTPNNFPANMSRKPSRRTLSRSLNSAKMSKFAFFNVFFSLFLSLVYLFSAFLQQSAVEFPL